MTHQQNHRRLRTSTALLAGGAIAAVAGLATLMFGTATAGATVTTCAAAPAGAGEINKNVDTTLGCDQSDGTMGMPATGWMTVHMPGGVSTATGADVFEANVRGGGHPYYAGSYVLSFTTVAGGTATGGTYSMAPTTVTYPDDPPVAHALSFTASAPGGVVTAQYSLSFTGSEPVAHDRIASITNNLFVWFAGNDKSTQVRTESVKPFTPGPTPTPNPTPTPTPTATPTGGAQGLNTPSGAVQGIHTPGTGAGPGDNGAALLLVVAGLSAITAGAALRRRTA